MFPSFEGFEQAAPICENDGVITNSLLTQQHQWNTDQFWCQLCVNNSHKNPHVCSKTKKKKKKKKTGFWKQISAVARANCIY